MRNLCARTCVASSSTSAIHTASVFGSKSSNTEAWWSSWLPSTRCRRRGRFMLAARVRVLLGYGGRFDRGSTPEQEPGTQPLHPRMHHPPIEDHGIIGDLNTVALVALDGAIDFLCMPHFDSPSVFAGLLDAERGGVFRIDPLLDEPRRRQLYLPDTNVLLTRTLSPDGVAEISDFMPISADDVTHRIVRRVKVIRGRIRFRLRCDPRFDYARARHSVEVRDGEVLFRSRGPDGTVLRLRASVELREHEGAAAGEFELGPGESLPLVLEMVREGEASPSDTDGYIAEAFKETVNYWRRWIGASSYRGRWQEMVHRSALTLKMLTSKRYGSMVAAPTFGLPEELGGERNWDYRYTWIRDATFTLYALIRLGFTREAGDFMAWTEALCKEQAKEGQLNIMYGIDGRADLTETELGHLRGYRDSRPVRVGNGAYGHLQLDIYGELLDSVYLYNKYGKPISHDFWQSLVQMVDWVCENWHRPDEGIWEVRSGRREFLYSRFMCWVAVDRAIRLARKRSLPAPLERWHRVRDSIYRDVFANFWNEKHGTFVQAKGSDVVDASTLLMPLVRFISPTDPRWLSTLREIERQLVDDSLVYRYRTGEGPDSDGLRGGEGTFSMCSFWYVECLSRSGDLEKARFVFEKTLGYANHLGLYAEELGPAGEHLGNFPQAFTHIALISTAYDLDRRLSGAGWTA